VWWDAVPENRVPHVILSSDINWYQEMCQIKNMKEPFLTNGDTSYVHYASKNGPVTFPNNCNKYGKISIILAQTIIKESPVFQFVTCEF